MASQRSMHHSQVLSPKPRPTGMVRSPSDPVRVRGADEVPTPPQQIYVLSADGSSLFLLDPTKPQGNEEPPPYAPFRTDVDLSNNTSSTSLASHAAGPSSPRSALNSVPYPSIVVPEGRNRASTVSTLSQDSSIRHSTRPGMRNHSSFSHSPASHHRQRDERGIQSASNSPRIATSALPDERTPLLHRALDGEEWIEVRWHKRRGAWKAIFCGELEEGDESETWTAAWKRFWRPVGTGRYWKAMVHLWFINFPFALMVWPPLLVGTLAGTALLITLPIGAAVWWLTLFIARSSARLETVMQLNYHSPLHPAIPQSTYHPIFYRPKERATPSSPTGEAATDTEVVWEKRFIKCSYAMFCDHYSYSALSYFLLIKPLIVLFSTIFLIAFFPVAAVLVVTLPVYLRAARRWGQWQAGVAIENL